MDLSSGLPNFVDNTIDLTTEYAGFTTKIKMYNGGKNQDANTDHIADAVVAYDCTNQVLCVAAYFTQAYVEGSAGGGEMASVDEVDENSWVEFGSQKFFQSGVSGPLGSHVTLLGFQYVQDVTTSTGMYSYDPEASIGWEGCWGGDGTADGLTPDVIFGDGTFQVHFNRGNGQTTSTGKAVGTGVLLCLCNSCDSNECTVTEGPCDNIGEGDECTVSGVTGCCDSSSVCVTDDSDVCAVPCALPQFDGDACTTSLSEPGCCDYGSTTCVAGNAECSCVLDDGTTDDTICENQQVPGSLSECQSWTCDVASNSCEKDSTDTEVCGTDPCTTYTCSDSGCGETGGCAAGENCCGTTCQVDACDAGCVGTCTVEPTFTQIDGSSLPVNEELSCTDSIPTSVELRATDCENQQETVSPVASTLDPDPVGSLCVDEDVTYTYTSSIDCADQTGTYSVTYSVRDGNAPVFTDPGLIIRECGATDQNEAPDYPSATDDCTAADDIAITRVKGATSGTDYCGDGKQTTYTFTATDQCGNFETLDQVVQVKDTTPPDWDLPLPADQSLDCDKTKVNDADYTSPSLATASDTCNSATVTSDSDTSPLQGDSFCGGGKTKVITWTATDGCGLPSTHQQTLTVKDETAPEFVIEPPATLELECGEAADTGTATAEDTCDDDVTPTSEDSGFAEGSSFCGDGATKTITWTAEDSCGNADSYVQHITVKDTKDPEFTVLPPDATLECGVDNVADYEANIAVSAVDLCDTDVTITRDELDFVGNDYCGGGQTKDITWTATDDCGLFKTHKHTIAVKDTVSPAIVGDIPEGPRNSVCSEPKLDPSVTGGLPAASDACDTSVVSASYCDALTATADPPGVSYTRTFLAFDNCGNCVAHPTTQVINIVDDCQFTVGNMFSGQTPVTASVSIDNISGGGVVVTVTVDHENADGAVTADLRGVFFQIVGVTLTDVDIKVTSPETDPTNFLCSAGGVDKLGKDVLMKGGGQGMPVYDCAVEIGTPGKSKDDEQSATFEVTSKTGETINTNSFPDDSYFGVRMTSVGDPNGKREDSAKIYDPVICCRHDEATAADPFCGGECAPAPPGPTCETEAVCCPLPSDPCDADACGAAGVTCPPPAGNCIAVCEGEDTVLPCPDPPSRNRRLGHAPLW